MVEYVINVSEENLDNKLRKTLAEYQSRGLISIHRMELTPYTMKLPTKSNEKPRQCPKPEDFVEAANKVITIAAQKNDQTIKTFDRGVPSSYVFQLDSNAWCAMMDKMLKEHRNLIEDMLEKKRTADSVNILAPFIGAVIDERVFQGSQETRKVDLIDAFYDYYGKKCSSVKTQLSNTHEQSSEFHELVSAAVKIAKEISK